MKSALSLLLGIYLCAACAAPPAYSPEERKNLAELWMAYMKKDPAWPAKREAALAQPASRSFLIENLIREMVHGSDRAAALDAAGLERADRAKNELAAIGPPAIPWLLALFTARDPAVAGVCSQAVAAMGPSAIPEMEKQMRSSDPKTRRWSYHALAMMEPPQKQAWLLEALAKDSEWTVRAGVVKDLLRYKNSESYTAIVKAFGDSDSFVRREAADALALWGDPRAIPTLIQYLELAGSKADPKEAEAAVAALRTLSKQKFGANIELWKQWWELQKK